MKSKNICNEIAKQLPKIKRGSLRIFGVWFGRPYDNVHTIVEIQDDGGVMKLRFDQCETLYVYNPDGVDANSVAFRIRSADRVRFEWVPYGSRNANATQNFIDFQKSDDGVFIKTNSREFLQETPQVESMAVELL